jgi:large subunit ribosomal protein L21
LYNQALPQTGCTGKFGRHTQLPRPQACQKGRRRCGEVKIGAKMRYAIVESGGKQYKAVEGDVIQVDHLPVETGEQVNLDTVLLMVDGDQIQVGTPSVEGVSVNTTVVEHIKGPKLIIFNYRPKKRYRVKTGHRQNYTLLKVDSIKE